MPDAKRELGREDVDRLKAEWLADPCWDIEDTEGFEAFRDELLAFRLQTENTALKDRLLKLEGDTSAVAMLGRIRSLEERVQRLEDAPGLN